MSRKRSFWKIVDQIEVLIESDSFTAGSRLPAERDLAERFNVSRPTVREAIIALEVKGRVEVRSNAGVFVNEKPVEFNETLKVSAFELTQARALVEGEAAALAALSIEQHDLVKLRQTLDKMENGDDTEQADREFHLTIARATSNSAIVKTVEYLWEIRASQPAIISAYKTVCDGGHVQRMQEHTAIYNALVNKDSNQARRSMHNHFNRLINALFDFSERKALEDVRRQSEENRGRFSLSHLHKSSNVKLQP